MKMIVRICLPILIALASVLVVLRDGQVQQFTEQEALARETEPPFAQALGRALPVPPMNYRQIWQHRQGNTTTDSSIERTELGR